MVGEKNRKPVIPPSDGIFSLLVWLEFWPWTTLCCGGALTTRSCAHSPPHQDTRIGIQVRSLWDGHSQAPCVLLEKWFKQRRPEPRLVGREIGTAHPLHHCLVARQQMRIDVESDCLPLTTALPQQFRVTGWS